MNPLRERVLDAKGFTSNEIKRKLDRGERIAILEGLVTRLEKQNRDKDQMWENTRSTEYIKVKDKSVALGRQVNEMRQQMDRLQTNNDKLVMQVKDYQKVHEGYKGELKKVYEDKAVLSGENEQLLKEVKELTEEIDKGKKKSGRK